MDNRRQVFFVAALLLLLLSARAVTAADPAVENIVLRMDRMVAEGKTADVLTEAKARVENSDTPVNRYLLGRAYGMVGEFDRARIEFNTALERDPGCAYAYHGLGAFYVVKGDLDEAERHLKNAIRLDPKFSRAHIELGKVYMTRQDALAAQRQFLKVLEYEPANVDVRILLAYQYLRDKRWERAADEFLVILTKDRENIPAQKGLAITYAMQKRIKEATEAFLKVLEKDPKDVDSYIFLTKLYMEKGDKAEAIAILERLLAVVPKDSRIAHSVAEEIRFIKEGRPRGGEAITLPMLLEQLQSPDIQIRRAAMSKLAEIHPGPPTKEMVRAVMDKDPVVRTIAIRYLGDYGGPRVLALLEILVAHPRDREKDGRVRAAVAQAIGAVGEAAGVPILLVLLSDPDLKVFEATVRSLRDLSGKSWAEDPSVPARTEERERLTKRWERWWTGPRAFSMKLKAIELIGELESRRMSRYLVELLGDSEVKISEMARVAFRAGTGVTIGTDEDPNTEEGRAKLMKAALVVLETKKKPKKADGD